MGVIPDGVDLDELMRHTHRPLGDACDYCGEPFWNIRNDPGVYWQLIGSTFWLHGPCAERLGVHLIRDALRASEVPR